jgi:hypothetical protein
MREARKVKIEARESRTEAPKTDLDVWEAQAEARNARIKAREFERRV